MFSQKLPWYLWFVFILVTNTGCQSIQSSPAFEYKPGYLKNIAEVTRLQKILAVDEADTFAGIYADGVGYYTTVALFTKNGETTLLKYTNNPDIVPKVAVYTLLELKRIKLKTEQQLAILGSGVEGVDINVSTNRVEVAILGNLMAMQTARQLIADNEVRLHPNVSLYLMYWDEL